MAVRGSKKELSQRHERHVAEVYHGAWSGSSGAAVTDEGDVRTDDTLFECKGRFGKLVGQTEVRSALVSAFEKVTDEAYTVSREPAMALRFYLPGNINADDEGWVDLVVRLLTDDAERTHRLRARRRQWR